MRTPTPLKRRNKKQRTLITPEGIGVPIQLASRGSRLGALMLDTLFLFLGIYLIFLVLDSLRGGVFEEMVAGNEGGGGSGAYEFITIISILVVFFARYGYFLTLELGPRGATWGKRLVGIRVAARGGGRLTPEAIIARNLLRDIELTFPAVFLIVAFFMAIAGEFAIEWFWAALIWFTLFMLFPFFNKDNLRAGDIIAGTWVVEAPKTKLAETMSTSG
ncbi:MAG: RDD family protein, partial [Pseudomonadota bacterium]